MQKSNCLIQAIHEIFIKVHYSYNLYNSYNLHNLYNSYILHNLYNSCSKTNFLKHIKS